MKFRTEINVTPFERKIDHSKRLFSVGSCFADSIAAKLERYKFEVESNPFGVLFNPFSLAATIESLSAERIYVESDLTFGGGLWFSYDFHGSFSAISIEDALCRMNESAEHASRALRESDVVIITFGTAWVYELNGSVVANCHKQPPSIFNRRRLSVDEVVGRFSPLFDGALSNKQVVLTVSPVRHLKDGFEQNSLSKAILRVATEELVSKYPQVQYFPAFEIVNDDLRDYRFYSDDMVHPSEGAVNYIWEKFCGAALTESAAKLLPRIENMRRAMEHRPFNPQTDASRKFAETSRHQLCQLQADCPDMDLSAELAFFGSRS